MMNMPQDITNLILSFLQTCQVCHTTYVENQFECEEDNNSECGFVKTCDTCREVTITHEGPMCRLHGDEWYEHEFE